MSLEDQQALSLLDLGRPIIARLAEVGQCHAELRGVCKELQIACDAARQTLLLGCPCEVADDLEALAKWPSLTSVEATFCDDCMDLRYSGQSDIRGHAETTDLLEALRSKRLVSLKLLCIQELEERALVNLLQACQGSLRVLELGGSVIVSRGKSEGPDLISVLQELKLEGLDLSGACMSLQRAPQGFGDWSPVLSKELCSHLRSLEIHVSEDAPKKSSFWSELGLRLTNLQKLCVFVPVAVKGRVIACELARSCGQLRELVVMSENDPLADSLFSLAPEIPHLERLEVEDFLLPATLNSFASRCKIIKRLRFALPLEPEQFELFRLGCSQLHSLETLSLQLGAWGRFKDDNQKAVQVRESGKRNLVDGILAIPNLKALELKCVPLALGAFINSCVWSSSKLVQVMFKFMLKDKFTESVRSDMLLVAKCCVAVLGLEPHADWDEEEDRLFTLEARTSRK